MSDHPFIPKSNSKIVPPFIPKPKESLEAEIARLKAEVELLRKAGDELLHEWSSGDETDGRNFKKGLVLWNAAKEGKGKP